MTSSITPKNPAKQDSAKELAFNGHPHAVMPSKAKDPMKKEVNRIVNNSFMIAPS
jgi:hypothetical protein